MKALPPGATVGIMGGGQLGRMLALAAAQLGFKTHIYSDRPGPACDVAAVTTIGAYDDLERVRAFAQDVDIVTYEFENVPVAAAVAAAEHAPVRPGEKALEVAQDRAIEKEFVARLGLPVAPFVRATSGDDVAAGMKKLGQAAILKTTRLGYDGKGQARIDTPNDNGAAQKAFDALGGAQCVLEARIAFTFEISVVLVRSEDGHVAFYDIPMNTHRDGILHETLVPSPLSDEVIERGYEIARTLADALDYVGVLAVEMFYLGDDKQEPLIVNEFAPRVHNSGHWTMDACAVSQFENHIRAVMGWPLGSTKRHSDAVMTNLIGHDVDAWNKFAAERNCCVHIYGKPETRPGRKMGHVTHLTPRDDA